MGPVLIDWLTDWLNWPTDRLIDWAIDQFIDWWSFGEGRGLTWERLGFYLSQLRIQIKHIRHENDPRRCFVWCSFLQVFHVAGQRHWCRPLTHINAVRYAGIMLKLLERPVFHRFPVIHHACDNTRVTCKYYNSLWEQLFVTAKAKNTNNNNKNEQENPFSYNVWISLNI